MGNNVANQSKEVKNKYSAIALTIAITGGIFFMLGNSVNSTGRWMVLLAEILAIASIVFAIVGLIKKERKIFLPLIIVLFVIFTLIAVIIRTALDGEL